MQELKEPNSQTMSEESIADLVHRALIQMGDMQAAEDKLKEIVQRSSAAFPQGEKCEEAPS